MPLEGAHGPVLDELGPDLRARREEVAQRVDRGAQLRLRQVHAEAVVGAEAEHQQAGVVPCDVELVRVGEDVGIAVGTAEAQHEHLTLADLPSPQVEVPHGVAGESARPAHAVADDLEHGLRYERAVGLHLIEDLRVLQQAHDGGDRAE